jgi:peroxiredoxin
VKEFVDKLGLTFPVAYGMDAKKTSRLIGAYYNRERDYIHRTNFLISPDNSIREASYNTGPLGRLTAQDVLELVTFYKSRKNG